jgi:hypothetical protein
MSVTSLASENYASGMHSSIRAFIAIVAVCAAVGAYIGLHNTGGGSQPQACGIVATGAKLCDGDLAAYCRGFVRSSLDQGTVEACAEAGVDVVK